MNTIEIYTIPTCPYCIKAKALLEDNYLDFVEYDISQNEDEMRKELSQIYNIDGQVTVPQVIINGKRLGGYTDLKDVITNGRLNNYLN